MVKSFTQRQAPGTEGFVTPSPHPAERQWNGNRAACDGPGFDSRPCLWLSVCPEQSNSPLNGSIAWILLQVRVSKLSYLEHACQKHDAKPYRMGLSLLKREHAASTDLKPLPPPLHCILAQFPELAACFPLVLIFLLLGLAVT